MKIPTLYKNTLVDLNSDNPIGDYVRVRLCSYLNIDANASGSILFTPGADAAIHTIIQVFAPGKNIAYDDLNYRYATKLICNFSVEATEVTTKWNLNNGTRHIEMSLEWAHIVYISSPDNRLGLTIARAELEKQIASFPNTLFIIDESYSDFHPEDSITPLIMTYPNLIIIRTFSKFFEIEHARVGYIMVNPTLHAQVASHIPQYVLAATSIQSVLDVVSDFEPYKLNAAALISEKQAHYKQLDKANIHYSRSYTDFITLVEPSQYILDQFEKTEVRFKCFRIKGQLCYRIKVLDMRHINII